MFTVMRSYELLKEFIGIAGRACTGVSGGFHNGQQGTVGGLECLMLVNQSTLQPVHLTKRWHSWQKIDQNKDNELDKGAHVLLEYPNGMHTTECLGHWVFHASSCGGHGRCCTSRSCFTWSKLRSNRNKFLTTCSISNGSSLSNSLNQTRFDWSSKRSIIKSKLILRRGSHVKDASVIAGAAAQGPAAVAIQQSCAQSCKE